MCDSIGGYSVFFVMKLLSRFFHNLFPKRIRLQAVIFQEGDWWVAQCLEYDIAAQAKSSQKVIGELQRILTAHVLISKENGVEPFSTHSRAPERYWKMLEEFQKPLFDIPIETPKGTPRVQILVAA